MTLKKCYHCSTLNKRFLLILWVALGLCTMPLQADVLVFVHGYLGDGGSWREAGITTVLEKNGWTDGGNLRHHNGQVVIARPTPKNKTDGDKTKKAPKPVPGTGDGHTFLTLDMPSEAPIALQARYLDMFLKGIWHHHPAQKIHIAAFSAGGLVARLAMVMGQRNNISVDTLITVATPHMGTQYAQWGSQFHDSPFGMMTDFLGHDEFNRSKALYRDLSPPGRGNMLGWLNVQPHPKARYVSVLRRQDTVVDPRSQNMNSVYALRGRSEVILTPVGHTLDIRDASLLMGIVAGRGNPGAPRR